MNQNEWRSRIESYQGKERNVVDAHTYVRGWPTASKPVLLKCSDDREYVVKGLHARRMRVNDQVVGLLGMRMNAPVGHVVQVRVPEELVEADAELRANCGVGLAHGCLWIPDCTERENIREADEPGNRQRFARLAILFGLAYARDQQFIYRKRAPKEVYSVDHGHFFHGGPNWTVATLQTAPLPEPDARITMKCKLTAEELGKEARTLEGIDDEYIADVVAAPPVSWSLSMEERAALADYLAKRRDMLLEKGTQAVTG